MILCAMLHAALHTLYVYSFHPAQCKGGLTSSQPNNEKMNL